MKFWAPELEPKLVSVLRERYTRDRFVSDCFAGVVVGIVALPLAIAFAIASGVRPEQGLFTAIVAGFVISALSGSRVQIGGPTGAFVALVFLIVERHGYEGLAVATVMAGVLLVIMGLARLGTAIRFIPYPVTVGFTTGIAIIIAAGQIRDALGLRVEAMPSEFLAKLRVVAEHGASMDPRALVLCLGTVVIVQAWPRITRKVPGSLVAILATALAVKWLDLPIDTVGSRFGDVPSSLPVPRIPRVEWHTLSSLVSPAVSIALLAGIESLLSALVADGMTGRKHRSNAELVAQGIANMVTPLFGGIPATGAIARTATNVKNGGTTPIAGIVHALTLVLILAFAGRWAGSIPMPTLAGILLVVAYNMSEWRVFARLFRGTRSDVLVLLVTFLLTVFVDLTVAIQAGVVIAALLLMRRMADVTQVRSIKGQLHYGEGDDPERISRLDALDDVEVFSIHGSFCFGAAQKFSEVISRIESRPRVVVLRMNEVFAMDTTGLHALEEVVDRFRGEGVTMLLSGVHTQPLALLRRAGLVDRVGAENVFESFSGAVARAESLSASSRREGGTDAA